jgi:acyl-CoA oxidase
MLTFSSLDLLATFNWICVYLLDKSFERVQQLQSSGQSSFDVRNNSQVFNAINLAIAYGQRNIFNAFFQHIYVLETSAEKEVLTKLLSLYGANLIVKNYVGVMYEGGFVQGINAGELLEIGILNLLPELKKEAISLIDAIAPPDFIVDSPLGKADGRVYDHLKSVIYQTPETFERPTWWRDMVHRDFIKAKM